MINKISIDKMIIHRIVSNADGDAPFKSVCSNGLVSVPKQIHDLIETRIVDALGRNGKSVKMKFVETEPETSYDYINKMFTDPDNYYIENSKKVVEKLTNAQKTRNIKDSVILIFKGVYSIDEVNYIIILKAETDESLQAIENEEKEGTYILQYVKDSLLGQEQKLYKVALITTENISSKNKDDYSVLMFDRNMDFYANSSMARYFYFDFLGCDFIDDGRKQTKEFFKSASKYLNNLDEDPEKKVFYINALYSYMFAPNNNFIDINEFANTYFDDPASQDLFIGEMTNQGILERFNKNQEVAISVTKRRYIYFSQGIKLSGPTDKFLENVEIENDNQEDIVNIKIKGNITKQW